MNSEHWQKIKDALAELAEVPAHERTAYLADTCGDDADLRAELERLLALDASASEYFSGLGGALGQVDRAPTQIGVYRTAGEIGRGGMGTVYLGQRNDGQFEQTVAIKVMRNGASRNMLARFRDERRILAQLQHHGIAYLLDGGSLPDGRLYFVMEYVKGEPITAYAHRKRLATSARLELFGKVCAAVSHAHRNLIIHRDLKPGNVLVQENDEGRPSIKLLDFGIARIIEEGLDEGWEPRAGSSPASAEGPDEADHPATAAHGEKLLTPGYAAPEQLRGGPVTTAADTYALGVLLHELLTGSRPSNHHASATGTAARGHLDNQPEAPSRIARRLSTADAAHHATTPRRLSRTLKGNLDSIILKAIERDPDRRHDSVAQLADDIQRHMIGHAVSARPDTATYRIGIFLRRHRRGVALATLTLAAVLGLGVFHSNRVAHERDLARSEADKAEQVNRLLAGILQSADPSHTRGEDVTVREVLDQASRRVGSELAGQPDVRATMESILGSVYTNLGAYDKAEAFLTRALEQRRELHGPHAPVVLDTLQAVATLELTRRRDAEAETILREVLAQRLRQPQPSAFAVAETRNDLGAALSRQGKLVEAERLYRQALATAGGREGAEGVDLRNNLAVLLVGKGQFAEAEKLYRQVLARNRELLGPMHPSTVNTLNNLGVLLRKDHRSAQAEPLLRESLALHRKLYGPRHPKVAISLNQLANALRDLQHYEQAEALYLEALEIRRAVLGPGNPFVAAGLNNLANLYRTQRDFAQAEPLYRQAIAISRENLRPNHPWTATFVKNLGKMYLAKHDPEAAEGLLREALRIRTTLHPDQRHWQVADIQSLLGAALARQQKREVAEPLLRAGYATLEQTRGRDDPLTRNARQRLAELDDVRSGNT